MTTRSTYRIRRSRALRAASLVAAVAELFRALGRAGSRRGAR